MADPDTLREACSDLLALLPQLEHLVTEPDQDGQSTHGRQWFSAPPWNTAVACVILDVWEGARRLEADLYRQLTGRERHRRGGSAGNTVVCVNTIGELGGQLGLSASHTACLLVERWLNAARRLPAVDEAPTWRIIRVGSGDGAVVPVCPYCRTPNLRVASRSYAVRCFYAGPCEDGKGDRPMARIEVGSYSGEPFVLWADGLIEFALPAGTREVAHA